MKILSSRIAASAFLILLFSIASFTPLAFGSTESTKCISGIGPNGETGYKICSPNGTVISPTGSVTIFVRVTALMPAAETYTFTLWAFVLGPLGNQEIYFACPGPGDCSNTFIFPTAFSDYSYPLPSGSYLLEGGIIGTDSGGGSFTVSAPTITTITPNPSSVAIGNSTTFKATVTDTSGTPTAPTGTVSWKDGGKGGTFTSVQCTLAVINSTSSSCTETFSPPSTAGTIKITGSYSGDSTHSKSSGSTSLKVTKRSTSTVISPSKKSIVAGSAKPISYTSTVVDTSAGIVSSPSGTVSWSDGGNGGTFSSFSCTLTADNTSSSSCSVTYTPSASAALGTIKIIATYSGDATHTASSGKSALKIT